MYNIEIKKSALKSLEKIPKSYYISIKNAIYNLSVEPRPSGYKKLIDNENLYRIRIGSYRVIYSINDNILIIEVVKIGHRKDIYK